jgi:uncharacterized YigZ family protein
MLKQIYHTIGKTAVAEYKDRGSKFIAYASPVFDSEGFKAVLQGLKKEHPKATHHCFAYRIGTEGNNFRVSDAGEPSGTAGKPILGQLDSRSLTNTLVVVVRYFGGTLLGIPGLINAYKSAAALVLQLTPIVEKQVEARYRLRFPYMQVNEVITILKLYQCTIYKKDLQLFSEMEIGIPLQSVEEFLHRSKEINNIESLSL